MMSWLSSTWEANWRSFQYFNSYRIVVAGVLFMAMLLPGEFGGRFSHFHASEIFWLISAYLVCLIGGLVTSLRWQEHFNWQLSVQVLLDVLVSSVLMVSGSGIGNGIGTVLLVSLAAASLVGRGRLVLFYAALATLGALLSQAYGVIAFGFDPSSIFQAGLLSSGYFATAILARLLGQRVMFNEDLARRRGIALNNQILISQCIVERMQDGVLIVDEQGLVKQSNPGARQLLGLPEQGMCALGAQVPELGAAFQLWREGGKSEFNLTLAGRGVSLRVRFEPTSSSDYETLVFLEDLQRIREHAQHLKLASLGRLTASIAHEIRNPLASISYAGELLREERCGEMQDRLLRILNDNVSRLDRIVQDVLDLGRQDRAQPESIVLGEYCRALIDETCRAENIEPSTIQVDGGESDVLCFDRAHWHQVLWNLLANALRYCSRTPGAILLSWRTLADGRVEVRVSDDGPGMSEKVREQIFEPFFTTHTQGTGLGLYIARELCSANAASLELENLPVGGAHFLITGRSECQETKVIAALAVS